MRFMRRFIKEDIEKSQKIGEMSTNYKRIILKIVKLKVTISIKIKKKKRRIEWWHEFPY